MNRFAEYLIQSIESIAINWMRSLLTALGIIIGVGSLIAVLAAGDSLTKSTQSILSAYSTSWAFITVRQGQPDPVKAAIRYDDAARVERMVPDADQVIPVLDAQMSADANHKSVDIEVIGAGAGETFDLTPLADGNRFTPGQVGGHQHVALISDSLRHKLFSDDESPIGQTLRLNGSHYRIVGVQKPPTTGGLLGGLGQFPDVTIPYTLAGDLGFTYVDALTAHAPNAKDAAKVGNEVVDALRKIHGERTQYDEEDIQGDNDTIRKTFGVLTGVVSVVAAISLLVGGVGIMNIMLVSVTERTREIGIRKAIGAARADIALQFFIEAILLCLTGGLIGLLLGAGLAEIVVYKLIPFIAGTAVQFSWLPIVGVALGFSIAVGLLFGTYPAIRASYLNPIDALRYE